ncbi:MAG: DUF4297 domain-containing protein [Planctomycetaceae bacterium]|nr:DUF4297 domain-containing protein [Planctomycetaceae bacterium]
MNLPYDGSGSRSSNRFSFQHSWGLGLVLKLHEKPGDYCVLFDIHEDVVALNSSVNPTEADMFQIKSDTTSPWTVAALTKREKAKDGSPKPSILGKLYTHYVRFPGHIKSLSFVTNAPYSVQLEDKTSCNDKETICISEIEATERAIVHSTIAAEHGVSSPPAGLATTYLVKTPLSVLQHEQHTEGRISEFLQKQGDGTIPPAPFHKTLRSELRRRNDKELKPATFAELTKYKGISRSDMDRMIGSVPSERKMTDLLATIRQQLVHESFNVRNQGQLNAEVRNYLAKRLDETNTTLGDARRRAANEVRDLPSATFNSATPVADVITAVSQIECNEFSAIRQGFSDVFLHAIIAVAIYEHHEFPTLGEESAEEEA